jgi:hypothetical protein
MRCKMKLKSAMQQELMDRLQAARVMASIDVPCDSGADVYSLDIALHTDQYIYGGISVCARNPREATIARYGIRNRLCATIEDIEDTVDWAVRAQNRHLGLYPEKMVA